MNIKTEWLYKTISLAIMTALFYLFYRVFSPFLKTIAWAMVLSITFYPLYRLLLRYIKRPWAASLITLIIILTLVIGPFSYIVGMLVTDITDVYSAIEQKGFEEITNIQNYPGLVVLFDRINSVKILEGLNLQQAAVNTLRSIGTIIAGRVSGIFQNTIIFIVSFIIMCITIFYFLKDGNVLAEFIKRLLPFSEVEKDRLEVRVRELVIAAIYGGVAVAVVQGILGGVAFLAFGLPSPVFWGTVMAAFSFVPLFGCAIIWVPAGLFLLSVSTAKGIGFLLYGILIISSIDNIIKPVIIGGRTKLHTLLVFFSVLGGIEYFGFLGFILGPLITALCLSLLEIYTFEEGEGG